MSIDDPATREANPAGETTGSPSNGLRFGAHYFAHDCGIPYAYNEHWLGFFAAIAERIVADLHPLSVLDAGCAIGMLVEALRTRGVDTSGIDVSEWAIANLAPGAVGHCRLASLAEPIPGRYDLVTCIEVIEHIPEPDASRALANLCGATDRILISSSPSDYAEPTHVNVRPPEDWAVAFAAHGFVRKLDYDASYITPWAVLYERAELTKPDLIRSYERRLFRLSREVQEVRATALTLQGRLEELAARVPDNDALQDLRNQLDASRQQKLTSRDQLIGLEGELGEALGQARELAAELERYRFASQELERFRRSAVWRLYEPYGRLRARFGRLVRAIRARLE